MVNKILHAQNELDVMVNMVTILNLYGHVLQFHITVYYLWLYVINNQVLK